MTTAIFDVIERTSEALVAALVEFIQAVAALVEIIPYNLRKQNHVSAFLISHNTICLVYSKLTHGAILRVDFQTSRSSFNTQIPPQRPPPLLQSIDPVMVCVLDIRKNRAQERSDLPKVVKRKDCSGLYLQRLHRIIIIVSRVLAVYFGCRFSRPSLPTAL